MKICVYGSVDILSEKCMNVARLLGEYIGKNGHTEFQHARLTYREKDKRQRKKLQAENADAFVVMPEGLGVLDELFEILLLKQYGEHNKEIYIVNIEHKYDLLISLLEEQGCKGLFTVISVDEFTEIGRS